MDALDCKTGDDFVIMDGVPAGKWDIVVNPLAIGSAQVCQFAMPPTSCADAFVAIGVGAASKGVCSGAATTCSPACQLHVDKTVDGTYCKTGDDLGAAGGTTGYTVLGATSIITAYAKACDTDEAVGAASAQGVTAWVVAAGTAAAAMALV